MPKESIQVYLEITNAASEQLKTYKIFTDIVKECSQYHEKNGRRHCFLWKSLPSEKIQSIADTLYNGCYDVFGGSSNYILASCVPGYRVSYTGNLACPSLRTAFHIDTEDEDG